MVLSKEKVWKKRINQPCQTDDSRIKKDNFLETPLVAISISTKLNECAINFQNADIILVVRRCILPFRIKKKILTQIKAMCYNTRQKKLF